jgi:hypothetical protein
LAFKAAADDEPAANNRGKNGLLFGEGRMKPENEGKGGTKEDMEDPTEYGREGVRRLSWGMEEE